MRSHNGFALYVECSVSCQAKNTGILNNLMETSAKEVVNERPTSNISVFPRFRSKTVVREPSTRKKDGGTADEFRRARDSALLPHVSLRPFRT